MLRLLTQKDACGFGPIDPRITAAAMHFVNGRAGHDANHIAAIIATTRNVYSMNRTGIAIEINGNRSTIAHGIQKPDLPATWREGPIAAINKAMNKTIRSFPTGARQ